MFSFFSFFRRKTTNEHKNTNINTNTDKETPYNSDFYTEKNNEIVFNDKFFSLDESVKSNIIADLFIRCIKNNNITLTGAPGCGKTKLLIDLINTNEIFKEFKYVVFLFPSRSLCVEIGKKINIEKMLFFGDAFLYDDFIENKVILSTYHKFFLHHKEILDRIGTKDVLFVFDESHNIYENNNTSAFKLFSFCMLNKIRCVFLSATVNKKDFSRFSKVITLPKKKNINVSFLLVPDINEAVLEILTKNSNKTFFVFFNNIAHIESLSKFLAEKSNWKINDEKTINKVRSLDVKDSIKNAILNGVVPFYSSLYSVHKDIDFVLSLVENKMARVVVGTNALEEGINVPFDDIIIVADKYIDKKSFIQISGRGGRFNSFGSPVNVFVVANKMKDIERIKKVISCDFVHAVDENFDKRVFPFFVQNYVNVIGSNFAESNNIIPLYLCYNPATTRENLYSAITELESDGSMNVKLVKQYDNKGPHLWDYRFSCSYLGYLCSFYDVDIRRVAPFVSRLEKRTTFEEAIKEMMRSLSLMENVFKYKFEDDAPEGLARIYNIKNYEDREWFAINPQGVVPFLIMNEMYRKGNFYVVLKKMNLLWKALHNPYELYEKYLLLLYNYFYNHTLIRQAVITLRVVLKYQVPASKVSNILTLIRVVQKYRFPVRLLSNRILIEEVEKKITPDEKEILQSIYKFLKKETPFVTLKTENLRVEE